MRTKILVIILLLFSSYGNAKQVTQEVAQQTAQTFLLKEQSAPPQIATETKGEFIVRNEAACLSLGKIQAITDELAETLAYVQELEPEGFIITSADDAIRPVLGFSFNGEFPFAPTKGNPLLDLIIADIYARKRLASTWSKETPKLGSSTQWGPWLQTSWHQTGHWNDRCPYAIPYVPGIRRPVGCVATAAAQIVNYWQYPSSMSFSSSDIFYLSGNIAGFGDAGTYGFPTASDLTTALQDILYNGDPDEEAYLCFGMGVKLHMDYGVFGSGANTYSVRNVLNKDLGFGSAVAYSGSNVWSLHRLEIIEDLKNGWPVQIAIHKEGKSGGHSIVVDGYRDNDEFFHLNYGWGATSPDPISTAWYNIPTAMPSYDVVHTVVYEIAKYQGWNQYGADQRSSFHAIYPSPIEQPVRKWSINVPLGLPIDYSFSHLVIGTGGRIYAALGPSIQGDIYHPYIVICDKFGTKENVIEVTHSNIDIPYLCQNSRGEVFFSSGTGGPTATNSKVYRLNPKTEEITPIFTHDSPDAGICERPIKVDRDDNLYFVIEPRFAANYAKLYCISRTGTNRWTPWSFPSSAEFHITIPAIDEEKEQVYLNYFEKTEEFKGVSHLIAFRRSDGIVIFDKELPTATHFASKMAAPPSIGPDGTIYVDADDTLFALNPNDGNIEWQRAFSWRGGHPTPSIGLDGTLYVTYDDKVMALDPASNGATKWEKSYTLGPTEYMGEIYSTANGMVAISYEKDGIHRLGGIKDNGISYEDRWDMVGGGTIGFGPGRTIISIPPGWEQSIWALTDQGDRGEPEGKGMDYADNGQPFNPSTPSPADGAVGQDTISVQLSWSCSDPDGHDLKYDIYACALVDSEEAAFVPVASQVSGETYTLEHLQKGTQYLWSVVATDGQAIAEGPVWSFSTEGSDAVGDDENILPMEYNLGQNYPNPFNVGTVIEYTLIKDSEVSLKIYNILGQKVRTLANEHQSKGLKRVIWDGKNENEETVSSGMYFYKIQAGNFTDSKRMLLLK